MPLLNRRVDGIDVYEGNNANWPGIADLNVTIAIAKAWHEGDAQDLKFRDFWPAMRDAGLLRGAFLLIKPQFDKNRTDIEAMVQHFLDRIDDVGGLVPGDLPPIIDYEGGMPTGGTLAARQVRALDQLVWALNKATPYTRQALRNPDALPMIYTGRALWMDGDALADPPSAYTTSDPKAADRITVSFSDFPLWWSHVHFDVDLGGGKFKIMDPLAPADLARVPYPRAWPGPRHFLFQFTGHAPFPLDLGGQADHDGNVIADVDAANQLSIPSDFSPILKLAGVAPPTADIELSRVTELSDQPPDQVFNLLLIGQGFWPDEFESLIRQGLFGEFSVFSRMGVLDNIHLHEGVADVAPLNLLFRTPNNMMLACYFDAGTHADGTGLFLRLRQEATRLIDPLVADPAHNKLDYDTLRIGHQPLDPPQVRAAGTTLAEYLSRLTVKLPGGQVYRATNIWPAGQRRMGPTGSLVAVLRKGEIQTHYKATTPTDDPRPAEYYKLDPDTDETVPFVAVNVVTGGDWPMVLARAIAQNLGGLGDEYELEGPAYAQPAEGSLDPLAPNVLTITDAQRAALAAGTAPTTAVPLVYARWGIPAGPLEFVPHNDARANPIPPWNNGFGTYGIGGFHLVEGGDGFRSHVLRCDRDCLMRRIPAAIADGNLPAPAKPPGFPIQSALRAFCEACQRRLRTVILTRTPVKLAPRIELDSQLRLFDAIGWTDRKQLQAKTVNLATTLSVKQPTWSCTAEFGSADGFRFTGIDLYNVEHWSANAASRFAHVLKSITFKDLQVELADGTKKPLPIPAALASTAFSPKFEAAVAGDTARKYQVGACLSLAWTVPTGGGSTATIDAKLSLVLAGMDNDVDPSGAMVACRIYPQIAMRVRRATKPQSIKSLRGTIVLEANNADAANLGGTLKAIANGKLTASLFSESNRSGTDARKRASQRLGDISGSGPLQPLPYWSWIYDYCRAAVTGSVKLTGVFSAADGPKGTQPREFLEPWPVGQNALSATIHRVPRQGAYDSLCIHPDRGNDAAGRAIVGGPICADLGLHLQWRRGISWSGGPIPVNVFRGWGAGRLGQGARTVLGAPCIPPNQHLDVAVTPAADRSTVTVSYAVVASDVAVQRWHVFLEQGLAYAFQYAVETALPSSWTMEQLGWLASAVGAGNAVDITLDLLSHIADPDAFDLAVRNVWQAILKRVRSFDATIDGSGEQQIPDGPSDAANLENL